MQKMARQETASRHQGKDGKGRKASAIAIIGMPSSARHAIGKARDARTQGIGMPSSASACHQGIIIGSSRTAGRSTVAQYSHTDFERVLRYAVVEIF
jgi:hypothetical protein